MKRKFLILFFILGVISIDTEVRGGYSTKQVYGDAISSKAFFCERAGDLFTVDIKDVDLGEVLSRISRENGVKFLLPRSVAEEKVMVRFSNLMLDEGLGKILQPYNRIFIYLEEISPSSESLITRLTEVRIYPLSYKGRAEKEPFIIISQNSKYILGEKPEGEDVAKEKRVEKSAGRGGESIENLSMDVKDENSGMSIKEVRALVKTGDESAIKSLSLAFKDKDPRVKWEAERALKKIGKSLAEKNKESEKLERDDSQMDAEEEEESNPGEGGKKSSLNLGFSRGDAAAIELSNEVPVRGVQFTLEGAQATEIRTTSRTKGFFAKVNKETGKVILVSMAGNTISPGDGPIAEVVCSNGNSASLSEIKIVE